MFITCLDVEGVLVPEIWVAFAKESGIPELTRTTQEEPDYDKLMKWYPATLSAIRTLPSLMPEKESSSMINSLN